MVNAIHSALELAKHLLPVSTGGPLLFTPRLPDVGTFLDELVALLGDSPAAPASDAETADEAAGSEPDPDAGITIDPKPGAVEERLQTREELLAEVERRLAHLPRETVVARLGLLRRALELLEKGLPREEDPARPAPAPERAAEAVRWGEGPVSGIGPSRKAEGAPAPFEGARPPVPVPFEAVPVPAVTNGEPPAARAPFRPERGVPAGAGREPLFRNPAAARAAESLSAVRAEPAANRGEFVEDMRMTARQIQRRGAGRIRMVLNPPHLGELEVDLSVKDRKFRAEFLTHQAKTRELILARLNELEESLRAWGLGVGEIRVDVEGSASAAPDGGETGVKIRRGEPTDGGRTGPLPGSSLDIVV